MAATVISVLMVGGLESFLHIPGLEAQKLGLFNISMIEKAKKYLLEHNVLWINPREQEQYRHVENFSTTSFSLTYNVDISNMSSTGATAFLHHLGDYVLENRTYLHTINYYLLRIDNQEAGIACIQRLADGRQRLQIRIEGFRL